MFKVNFMANQEVTAEDINGIGYNLANTQYTTFADNTTYGINALNAITQHLVTVGVRRNDEGKNCNVTLKDGKVYIDSGTAFFGNGAVMEIDENGITLEIEDSTAQNYVYLFYDSTLNIAGARCTIEQPSNEDCVLLGTVQNGTAVQNRDKFCKHKVHDAPQTPLIIYNDVEFNNAYTTETIPVPELYKYTIARVTYLDCQSDELDKYGDWALVDITAAGEPIGIVVRNAREYSNRIYAVTYGNPTYVFMNIWQNRYYADQSVRLGFDLENNQINLSVNGNIKAPKGGIKIELFAGEVTN